MSRTETEILINVYDLLPPGRVSSILWTLGGSLLHSGVVVKDKEYAYGGHDRAGLTGVYYTRPRHEPPGATFRCEISQGISLHSEQEIERIIRESSKEFLGRSYNLLTRNCNHFTSFLCEKLTSRPAPHWLNRAASVGVALNCVLPREFVDPPDYEDVDGALVDEIANEGDEQSSMLRRDQPSRQLQDRQSTSLDPNGEIRSARHETEDNLAVSRKSDEPLLGRDSSGRGLPPSEQAPVS